MSDIYQQHRAAFAHVEAFVVLKGAERVATVAFKFPRDGAGRLYAYVHWLGLEMVRGYAGGGGYDKRSAAVADAARRMPLELSDRFTHPAMRAAVEGFHMFRATLAKDDGHYWDRRLRDAGFTVLQAV